ncbi:MAG: acyl-CoA dehydratase activase [Ignavibacteriales bacterium]
MVLDCKYQSAGERKISLIVGGCDVGSLTAKAVLLNEDKILATSLIRVRPTPLESATVVMQQALQSAGVKLEQLECCCATGYGRFDIPFAQMNLSEISCHGMGAFWLNNSIRTVIDIGGQDCKVIALDGQGAITEFAMNDKCAAGTGRVLEMLSKTLDLELNQLGPCALKSRKPQDINNKCSIFMELEVLNHLYHRKKVKDIACGVCDAVAKRVAGLARGICLEEKICITGGVSKNVGVVKRLEKTLDVKFTRLPFDSQLMGALGAAVLAMKSRS